MTDVNPSTEHEIAPNCGKKVIYFKANKGAQNDTVTFSNYSKVLEAHVMVEPASGNWVEGSVERVSGTSNQIKLTNSTTGTAYGRAVVEE